MMVGNVWVSAQLTQITACDILTDKADSGWADNRLA